MLVCDYIVERIDGLCDAEADQSARGRGKDGSKSTSSGRDLGRKPPSL